jgi:hypothetical protein
MKFCKWCHFNTVQPCTKAQNSFKTKVKLKLSLWFNWAPRHGGVLWKTEGITPCILDLDTTWRWVVSFMLRSLYLQGKSLWYPLDRRLDGPQNRSGRGGEEKNSQPLPGLEPPIIQPVAWLYTTELTRLLFRNKGCAILDKRTQPTTTCTNCSNVDHFFVILFLMQEPKLESILRNVLRKMLKPKQNPVGG